MPEQPEQQPEQAEQQPEQAGPPEQAEQQPEQAEQAEPPAPPESRRWTGPVTLLLILAISVGTFVLALLDSGGADTAPPRPPTTPPAMSTPSSTSVPPGSLPSLPSP